MKRNAVIRIVIWSAVLLLLVALLLVGLSMGLGWRNYRNFQKRDQTVASATLEPEEVLYTGTVTEAAYARKAPSLDSNHAYPVKVGQTVEVLRVEIVAGDEWLLIKGTDRGWLQSRYVQLDEELPKVDFGTAFTEEAATKATDPEDGAPLSGTVTETVNVRTSPSNESERVGALEAGQSVTIAKREAVAGQEWALITEPVNGWIILDYVELEDLPSDSGTASPATQTGPLEFPAKGTAPKGVNVRKSPSNESERVGTLEAGQSFTIVKQETVSGIEWGQITEPMEGWVVMEYVELDGATPTEAPAEPATEETTGSDTLYHGQEIPAKQVSAISIDWLGGNITVEPWDGSGIHISEEDSAYPMVWQVKGATLDIQFTEKTDPFNGWRLLQKPDKDLTIQVPKDWTCKELELDAASAKLFIRDMSIDEVELDTASGTSTFENCQVDSLDVDTASGDVVFSGTLNTVEYDAASADLIAVLSNVPRRIDMDSASGSLDLTLPEDAGFSLKMETMSGKFTSDFPTQRQNGRDISGDGACKIDMDAMSGSVTIRKGN